MSAPFEHQPTRPAIDYVSEDIDRLTQGLSPDELQVLLLNKFMASAQKEGVGPDTFNLLASLSRTLANAQETAQRDHETAEATQPLPALGRRAIESNASNAGTSAIPVGLELNQPQPVMPYSPPDWMQEDEEPDLEKHDDDFSELLEALSQNVEGIAMCGKFPKGINIPAVNPNISGVSKEADGGYKDFGVYSTEKGAARKSTRNLFDMMHVVRKKVNVDPFITVVANTNGEKGLVVYYTPVNTVDAFHRPSQLMTATATLPLEDARKLLHAVEANSENGERFIQRVFKGISTLEDRTEGTLRTIDEKRFAEITDLWGEVQQADKAVQAAQRNRDMRSSSEAYETKQRALGALARALRQS